MEKENIFHQNEIQANHYVAICLLVATGVAVACWGLNIVGFFIVDDAMMNLAMPVAVFFLLLPQSFVWRGQAYRPWLKYLLMGCFLLAVTILAMSLTIHLVVAWAFPVVLSCHYYDPRFTGRTLAVSVVCMLVSIYLGLLVGLWDCNMMRSNEQVSGVAARMNFIRIAMAAGDNVPVRIFSFYFLPRAALVTITGVAALMLNDRTHTLLENHSRQAAEQQRISTELHVATGIQEDILPNIFPAFPGRDEFEIYATMTPAKEVGGDFYDYFLVDDDHLGMVIADVSDKGVPAALFMMIAKTLIKNAASLGMSPAEVLSQVNEQLCENNKADMFVTVWLGIMEISTGRVVACNGGHEYPILRDEKGLFTLMKDVHGLPLGAMQGAMYKEYEFTVPVGGMIYVYTDGVAEASDRDKNMYGLERLMDTLQKSRGRGPVDLLHYLADDLHTFVGEAPQFDDITMLCMRRKI